MEAHCCKLGVKEWGGLGSVLLITLLEYYALQKGRRAFSVCSFAVVIWHSPRHRRLNSKVSIIDRVMIQTFN